MKEILRLMKEIEQQGQTLQRLIDEPICPMQNTIYDLLKNSEKKN